MIGELHFKDSSGVWKNLPGWAVWYVQTGMLIGSAKKDDNRLVLGISTPIRNFSSLLIALGVIHHRSQIPVEDDDFIEYFEFLKSLPNGTVVSFLKEERTKKIKGAPKQLKIRSGKIDGVRKDSTGEYIEILYVESQKNKTICKQLFTINTCHKIMVTGETDVDISSTKKKGRAVVKNLAFLSQFLSGDHISDFTIKTRVDCFFIGFKQKIFSELNYIFALKEKTGEQHEGNLQDLIRPRKIHSFSQSFRSIIYSSSVKKPPSEKDNKPWCIIYDSANGYLKWHHRFSSSHQVILLDRTERLYENAVLHLNNRFYNRCNSEICGITLPTIPPGVEVISFLESCNV